MEPECTPTNEETLGDGPHKTDDVMKDDVMDLLSPSAAVNSKKEGPETSTEREVLLHSSDDMVHRQPGMEQRQEVGVAGELGMERGPHEAAVTSVTRKATDNTTLVRKNEEEKGVVQTQHTTLAEEKEKDMQRPNAEEKEEEKGQRTSEQEHATNQSAIEQHSVAPTAPPANDIAVPRVVQTSTATTTSQVVMETTTIAMETPELSPEVAVATSTAYPSLTTLAAVEEEQEEEMVPFSEEDLGLLYQNRQLEAREEMEEAFIRDSHQEHHPLYELLSLYQKSLLALATAQAQLKVHM